jgi:transposase InsO family protein
MKRVEQLQKIWAENGYPGSGRLWTILKQMGLTRYFTRKEVESHIGQEKVSQLHHKPVRVKGSHITTSAPAIMYCIDLLDMTAYARDNGGVKWLLLCIDVFTRSAAIVGIKNKTAPVVADALQEAFDEFGEYPKIVLSDQGSEFKGATAKLLEKHGIIHKVAEVGDHARLGLVDRFSGVVKGWIARHMTQMQTKRYVDVLQDLVASYNNAPHSSLGGMTPLEAWKYPTEARDYHYGRIQKAISGKKGSKIEVGSWVRVLNLKGIFSKGYHVKYSLTPHKVVEIQGMNYILDNGKFYRASRLLRIPDPKQEEEAPRDVAKEARRERKKELILQQEGVDPVSNPPIRRNLRERKVNQLEDVRYGRIRY